jgi:probable HAF family extracellular repeat protein
MTPRRYLVPLAVALVAGCVDDEPTVVSTESSALSHTHYVYRNVDFTGATTTIVLGVNDLGQYVGLFVDAAHTPHAMWFDGRMLASLDPGGVVGTSPRSRAYAINNLGDVVGSYSDVAGNLHGFARRGHAVTTIDAPDGSPTEAYGINDLGDIIGVTYDADGNTHGFSLRRGVFRSIDLDGSSSTVPLSINDRGEVVGEDIEVAGTIGHGYRQTRSGAVTTYDAPEASADSTYFVSINNRDEILGAYFDDAFEAFNFVLRGDVATPFDLPGSFGATSVTAQTINDLGEIVGYYSDAAGATHGFLATRSP